MGEKYAQFYERECQWIPQYSFSFIQTNQLHEMFYSRRKVDAKGFSEAADTLKYSPECVHTPS